MRTILLFSFLTLIFQLAHAQTGKTIFLKNGSVSAFSISRNSEMQSKLEKGFWESGYFAILNFENESEKHLYETNGIIFHEQLAKNTYTVFIPKNFDCSVTTLKYIAVIPAAIKVSENIFQPVVKGKKQYLAISYYGITSDSAILALKQSGCFVIPHSFSSYGVLYIAYKKELVPALSEIPFITSINFVADAVTPLNNESRAAHNISAVAAENGRNLTGKNVTIGHGDIGLPQDHIDIFSKSIDRYSGGGNFHGNHTSGTASGAGIINEKYKGIAFKSPTVNCYFTDILVNTPAYIADYNMVATNNSYYSGLSTCAGNRAYNELSRFMDQQVFANPGVLHVFSAGNDGLTTCNPYLPFFGTVKSGFQTAKNVLTVGSMNADTYTIAGLSSRGPIFDGRIKPEIVAKGENATSTVPFNIYDFTTGGTSMAAPVITGAIALLQERYKQLFGGVTSKSDLVKALLCNSADDLGNNGPDYTYGFGMLNLRKSVESMEQNQFFNAAIAATGSQNNHTINVPANTRRLKLMLYYIDKEANLLAANSLVNDLDMKITTPASSVHFPLILNSSPLNVNNPATEGADHINNIEQIILENPVAGIYTVNITGFNLPVANQNYVVVYCFEKNGLTLEYPFGNEKLVPGETEKIRWQGYGNEANNFTLEYSDNNGVSYTVLDANIANTSRVYHWMVPATATNQGLFRISRNGTADADVSDFNFTVLNVPVISLTNVCDGSVQVNWSAISNATGYEVMIKDADSMKRIGITTGLDYLVKGLQANTEYWFTVRALNGIQSGRRALAKNIVPNSGPCTFPDFDNDIKLVSINTPNNGRSLTVNAANALQVINITVKNNDDAVSNTPIQFHYSINGGALVTESATPVINPNTTFNYSFASHSPTGLPAIYNIKVWVTKTGDNNTANDTLEKQVKLLTNPVLTLPFTDDFESTTRKEYLAPVIGLENNDKYDIGINSIYGRARTFVNTGFSHSGSNAVTLDQRNVGSFTTDTLIGTYNLSSYDTAAHQLRLDFYYKDHGQEDHPNNKVWIRGSDLDPWIEAFLPGVYTDNQDNYHVASININNILATATPKQNVSASFQVAFGQQGVQPAVSNPATAINEDGYTFDDIKLVNALNDIGLIQIFNPLKNACNLSAATPVTVQVKNYSNTIQNNIQVSYRINNGSVVTENIPVINPRQTVTFTFAATANLGAYIEYNLDFWVKLAADNYPGNDSILLYNFHNSPLIGSYPYLERFENNDGYWFSKGANSSWQWGAPVKPVITHAANGSKIWTTSLNSGYNDNELSYLYSPCFDLSGLTNPMLSFSHITRVEDDCPCDNSWMEYSSNGGQTWQKLGSVGQGTNWYDDPSTQTWKASITHWHVASIAIPSNSSTVKFRYVMSSDGGVNYAGVGIDDIHIYEGDAIYTGATISSGLTQTVNGNNWIDINSSNKRIVSIQPNNNNLGNTEVKVYNYTGTVRNSNNQYYPNRNIVIQPTTQPGSAVMVRFYFTDAEMEAVLNASGCGTCTKPADAFEMGVTKYSGLPAVENGDLLDNTGFHDYIPPGNVDVIPYQNGYYAEFIVNSFSEFWLNHGGTAYNLPLPVTLLDFYAKKMNQQVLLNWNAENESGIISYEIERSGSGNNFVKIGSVNAGYPGNNNYTFTDNGPLTASNYYRLKIISQNGNSHYSPVRVVSFKNNEFLVLVSPNPSKNRAVQLTATENITRVQVFNTDGKMVYSKKLNTKFTILNLAALPVGIYTLKLNSETNMLVKKLLLE